MRYAVLIVVSFFLAAFLVGSVIVLDDQAGSLRSDLTTQQQQVATLRSQLVAAEAKLAGGHRDLVTCADLQQMGLMDLADISLNTDTSGNLSAVPDLVAVPLPSHCINQ